MWPFSETNAAAMRTLYAGEEHRGDFEAKRFGVLEVDDQFKSCRPSTRCYRWLARASRVAHEFVTSRDAKFTEAG
jgi:hypothetical protein